jgi:hypothetical protein
MAEDPSSTSPHNFPQSPTTPDPPATSPFAETAIHNFPQSPTTPDLLAEISQIIHQLQHKLKSLNSPPAPDTTPQRKLVSVRDRLRDTLNELHESNRASVCSIILPPLPFAFPYLTSAIIQVIETIITTIKAQLLHFLPPVSLTFLAATSKSIFKALSPILSLLIPYVELYDKCLYKKQKKKKYGLTY